MKNLTSFFILLALTGCSGFHHRPVQDQSVGGSSFFDALTGGRERVGLVAKQAHYDSFIAKPVTKWSWVSHIPLVGFFVKPISSNYEICRAPPADAMASTASALSAAFSAAGSALTSTKEKAEIELAATMAETFANKVKAFSFRTQGIQYIRDVRFDNCVTWLNRAKGLKGKDRKALSDELRRDNQTAEMLAVELIRVEILARAKTNNFGAVSAEMSETEMTKMQNSLKQMDTRSEEKMKEILKAIKTLRSEKEKTPGETSEGKTPEKPEGE